MQKYLNIPKRHIPFRDPIPFSRYHYSILDILAYRGNIKFMRKVVTEKQQPGSFGRHRDTPAVRQ
jgi:hypothetical protein